MLWVLWGFVPQTRGGRAALGSYPPAQGCVPPRPHSTALTPSQHRGAPMAVTQTGRCKPLSAGMLSFTLRKFTVGCKRNKYSSATKFHFCQVHGCLWRSGPALAPVTLQPGDHSIHMRSRAAPNPPLRPCWRRMECSNSSAWFLRRSQLRRGATAMVLCPRAPATLPKPLLPFAHKRLWLGDVGAILYSHHFFRAAALKHWSKNMGTSHLLHLDNFRSDLLS